MYLATAPINTHGYSVQPQAPGSPAGEKGSKPQVSSFPTREVKSGRHDPLGGVAALSAGDDVS
ncbi:uncharacterized protein SETTUDRAFT_161221 [Exserohilum turcica Et28A]|uniref:Uncharacterized protein n=1 Tax=Exserohilum turcicum (strain 28A) TaxID=671987 RepID=R0INI5_EXST2|nr:uncharacterized protein SETTUDRAFT_161221 [Exserohilum turcica Et28A]EOA86336.1 hypothetical protein SETTUDRAFT_161221 [Exserohilum turcica Et28A]